MNRSRTTIRVYEYDRLRVGDVVQTTDGREFTFSTSHFEALARFHTKEDHGYYELGHRLVRFRQFVGFLQVGDLGIEVLPKADRARPAQTYWRDALLDMLATVHRLPVEAISSANLETSRANLLEVYIAAFLTHTERLLHEGLSRGYRRQRDNLTVFRGRLITAEHIRRNLAQAQRAYTEHQVYNHDRLVNQLLAGALQVLTRIPLSNALAVRVQRCASLLPPSVTATTDPRAFDRLTLDRATRRYEAALELAELILLRRSPHLRAGGLEVLALMFDMNVLWERYILALLRRVTPSTLEVSGQTSRRFWRLEGGRTRTIRPDICVRDRTTDVVTLVLDTKWKIPKNGRPEDNDLKQMYVYNEQFDCPRSLLVYPASGTTTQIRMGSFEDREHRCGVARLNLFDARGFSKAQARGSATRLLDRRQPIRSG